MAQYRAVTFRRFMKSRQLANVLIKMLGLSVFIYAIPAFFSSVFFLLASGNKSTTMTALGLGSALIRPAVDAIVGVLLITNSQNIAGWMFKSGDE